MRVLFVDDNAMNRMVVKSMLAAADVTVVEADDGQTGLALLEAHPFDLILMDYRMPGMDGLAVIGQIRARSDAKRLLPIILVTADDGSDLQARAAAAGADDLLHKPILMSPLFDTIGRVLSKTETASQMLA